MDGIQRCWRFSPQACPRGEWGRRGRAPAQTGLPETAGEEGALHQHQGGMCQPHACPQRPHTTPEPRKFPPYGEAKPARDVSLDTSASPSRASPDSTRPGHQVPYALTSPLVRDPPSTLSAVSTLGKTLTIWAGSTLHPQWCVYTG